ncbi:M20/M25/M40 family metallo-hydrolase [Arenibacter sp. GZD96]|uniref:M20/M25/M40 family metallo-hydrolase n=1 Tax=Aurantibrevibacter litoralis TaxID=3106030 RepID=UPI002AFF6AD5|nr:M20/M25/M40 family metallo-hydrolase [Arenibacter sp. GZD-96]MEA1786824.1 M20/M25/M40 family metallo-hydrolase [Arenibacter sp. GZD-96]
MKKYLVAFLILAHTVVMAQDEPQLKSQVRHTIDELRDFVSIPNDALEHADINRNITWLTKKFNDRGFNTSVLPTDGESLFFAALPLEDNKPTILFYMHFDGQSVDKSKWDQPNPYEVVLKSADSGRWKTLSFDELKDDINYDWRLFGRSTSDDKGPIVMFLNAIDLLKKNGKTLAFNIKVILDSEEERGSKPLPKAIKEYRELLQADFLVINDGPVHSSGKPTLVYGARGITTFSLTTYGPIVPQHSGHYGNYAPNPGLQLAQLLASIKDTEGKVLIPNFYDGIVLDDATKLVLKGVPDDEAAIKENLQIKTAEKVGSSYQESLQYPSLNIRGLGSAWVGENARTIVPATATAELDIRLVPESDGTKLKTLVKNHIQKQGFFVTNKTPSKEERLAHDRIVTMLEGEHTHAFRTDLNDPYGLFLAKVLHDVFKEDPVHIRIMGGTVPIAPFINELKIPAFIVPMVNPDNNQHSPNENLSIGMIAYGIQTFYGLLSSAME